MPTRSYTLHLNLILGLDRELTPQERRRLRHGLIDYLNRNWNAPLAIANATNGGVRIVGPAHLTRPPS